MKRVLFSDLFNFEKKSTVKAGEGRKEGKYPFYTSSTELSKRIDDFLFDKPALIFGTGGQASIHYSKEKFSVSTDCLIASPIDIGKVDSRYVFYYLFGNLRILEEGFRGAGLKHISKSYISDIDIPLPPFETQKKIATILDKADELRQNDKKILEKYDQLARSVFMEMFGDPAFNSKNWPLLTLPEFSRKEKHSIKRGPFGGALKKEIFVDRGYLVYEQYHAINDDFSMARYFIDEEKFNELYGFKVVPGDLIISCSGVTLGRIAEIPHNAQPGIINQALLKISLDNRIMNNTYFKYLFSHSRIQDILFGVSRGSGIPNFPPMGTIKAILFTTPPIEFQNKFASIISQIKAQRQLTIKSLQKSEELFQSLLQRAFKGELV